MTEPEPAREPPVPHSSTAPILRLALQMVSDAMPARGDLLDVPCGTGYLSTEARSLGWRVRPADIAPEAWRGDPSVVPDRVDLNAALPFPDRSADAIVSCEGVEHLENPWIALREFRRIVRPGGRLVVSIPNTVDVRQRWRMLRTGHWSHYFPSNVHHINHMGTFVLCHALLRSGFDVLAVRCPKTYGRYLRPIVPLFRFGEDSGLPAHIRAMLSSPEVLLGRTVVVLAAPA